MTSKPARELVSLNQRDGADTIQFDLPVYAVRYLKQMCIRERSFLINVHQTGAFSPPIVEAASDALKQIEKALAAME